MSTTSTPETHPAHHTGHEEQHMQSPAILTDIVIDHPRPEAAWELCLALKENGLLAKPTHGDKIRLAPPLVITRDQLLECVAIVKNSLNVLAL